MDPPATLRSCRTLVKEIYDLKRKMDENDEACNLFFARIQTLIPPLERLKQQSQQILCSKRELLEQINDYLNNILRIANYRVKQKKTVVSFLKKVHESFSRSLKENLSELNLLLDRCIHVLMLCISMDGESKFEMANSQKIPPLSNTFDTVVAGLQADSLQSDVENHAPAVSTANPVASNVSKVAPNGGIFCNTQLCATNQAPPQYSRLTTLMGHSHLVSSIVCDKRRNQLFSGSYDKSIKVWDMSNYACVGTIVGHTNFVNALVCDESRGRLYSGSTDRTIKVWRTSSHECEATLSGHTDGVLSLVCDVKAGRLYSGSYDKSIKAWDMSSLVCVATLAGHTNYVNTLVCDSNRGLLYSGSSDQTIKVWDTSSYHCVATLSGHSGAVCSLVFDRNTSRLCSGSTDGTIKIWDLSSLMCVATLIGHTNTVNTLVLVGSGSQLYSGSSDSTIKVWDMSSHACVATISGHYGGVYSLVCDVKSNLLSGSGDATIKVGYL